MEGCCAAQAAAQADGLLEGPLCTLSGPLFSRLGCHVCELCRWEEVLIIESVQGPCWACTVKLQRNLFYIAVECATE